MDIWAWVRSTKRQLLETNPRLAELMDRLPTAVCDNEHDQVDALYPEALALARKAGNPWIEVFVRHWHLQSRILHRHEVADWTGEAVSLIEFANRPEARECPQSVCVTQDLVNAYGNVDGPGFAEERLAATAETLERIDPRWPCWVCISSERADALVDAGRFEEALAFVDAQTDAMVEAGVRDARKALAEDRAMILMQLERHYEALAMLDDLDPPRDRNDEIERRIDRARLFVRMDDMDRAFEALPTWDQVEDTPGLYPDWAEAVVGMVRGRKLANDWQMDARLEAMTSRLIGQGVRRVAVRLLFDRADLALKRRMPHVARECLDRAEALFDGLHRILDARGEAVALRGRLNVADPIEVVLPHDEDLFHELPVTDPEGDAPMLAAAKEKWPDSAAVALRYAQALNARGRYAEARGALEAFLETHDAPELASTLGQTLLDTGDHLALRRLCEGALARDPSPELASQCHWLLARSFKEVDQATCRAHLEQVVAIKPEATNCQTWLAQLEREAGDWRVALDRLSGVTAREPEAGSYDWDRLVLAELVEDWDAARDSARRIGYEIPDDHEGPIRLPGILCRIQFDDGAGKTQILYARRSGPVTANIVQMRADPPSHYGDAVIFDAAPLNEGPQPGEEERHTWLYRCLHVVEPGGYVVHAFDGVHPGSVPLDALRTALAEAGCESQVLSGDSYRLRHPDTGKDRLGLYMMVGVPDAVSAADLDRQLGEITSSWPEPLTWLTLANAAGNEVRIRAHQHAMERYGM